MNAEIIGIIHKFIGRKGAYAAVGMGQIGTVCVAGNDTLVFGIGDIHSLTGRVSLEEVIFSPDFIGNVTSAVGNDTIFGAHFRKTANVEVFISEIGTVLCAIVFEKRTDGNSVNHITVGQRILGRRAVYQPVGEAEVVGGGSDIRTAQITGFLQNIGPWQLVICLIVAFVLFGGFHIAHDESFETTLLSSILRGRPKDLR